MPLPKPVQRMIQRVSIRLPDGRIGEFFGEVFLKREEMERAKKEDCKVTLHEPVPADWGVRLDTGRNAHP